MFICEIGLFDWYLPQSENLICRCRISRSDSEGPFDFEIARVDYTWKYLALVYRLMYYKGVLTVILNNMHLD